MKKRYYKVIIVVIIGLLIILSNSIIKQNINTFFSKKNNITYYDNSCYEGIGTTYYVTGELVKVYDDSNDNHQVDNIVKCSEVKVYCKSNNYAKISKIEDRWVSMEYLSLNNSTCGSIITTTRPAINFRMNGSIDSPIEGLDFFYTNKGGKVKLKLTNITNAAIDDQDEFDVKIFRNSTNVTSLFTIDKSSIVNNKMSIDIILPGDLPYDKNYTYNIEVKTNGQTRTYNFVTKGKYYTYSFESNGNDVPANEQGVWSGIYFNDEEIDFSNNMSKFTVKVVNSLNDDYTTYFNIEKNSSTKTITIKNKIDSYDNMLEVDNYTAIITYDNLVNTWACGEDGIYVSTIPINITERDIDFTSNSEVKSYQRVTVTEVIPYDIDIFYYDGSTIRYMDNSISNSLNVAEFKHRYKDFDPSIITKDSDNNIVYRYNDDVVVTNYDGINITYKNNINEEFIVTKEAFKSLSLEAFNNLEANYNYMSDGKLMYHQVGNIPTEVKKIDRSTIKQVFALSGGEFNFSYKVKNLFPTDIINLRYEIVRLSDGRKFNESDGFKVTFTQNLSVLNITIDYDNSDAKYIGDYQLILKFKSVRAKRIDFSIRDAEEDFYLFSEVDRHLDTDVQLREEFPPANKKYEYLVGLYLIKGGQKQEKRLNISLDNVRIYDEMVSLDDANNLYYYKQIEYQIEIEKVISGNVTFKISENGNEIEEKTLSVIEFKDKYKDLEYLIDNFNYDSEGNIISDKFSKHVNYIDNSYIKYYEDGDATLKTEKVSDFQLTNSDIYYYIANNYVFDNSNNVILGTLKGEYNTTTIDGSPVVGHDVTDKFDITIDSDLTNVKEAIKILPKTEVDAGRYYIYVDYDIYHAIGYINNKTDAQISKVMFPRMWNRNTHMTTFTYSKPEYDIDITDIVLSNDENDIDKLYENILGHAEVKVKADYIYDFSNLTTNIEYYDEDNNTWIDANEYFVINNKLEDNLSLVLDSVLGKVKAGEYRIKLNYLNKGESTSDIEHFIVSKSYYGLSIVDQSPLSYYHNYTDIKEIDVKAKYIINTSNINFKFYRKLDNTNKIELDVDYDNKLIKENDITIFNYNISIDDAYYSDAIRILMSLSNISNVTREGNYEIEFYYSEGSSKVNTYKNIIVEENHYEYNFVNMQYVANNQNYVLTYDIETSYINEEYLDNFDFVVKYSNGGEYIDVSSSTSTKKMVESISYAFNLSTGPNYRGTLTINFEANKEYLNGDYYLEVIFRDDEKKEIDIPSLEDLFGWSIESPILNSVYTETTSEGEVINTEFNKLYSNLLNASIEVNINSHYEENASWTINKDCVESEVCDPTTGINYNDLFTSVNTTVTDGKLTLYMKHDIPEDNRLTSGKYALIIYYASNDYKIVTFNVEGNFAYIEFKDAMIYSKIEDNGEIKNYSGLYRNSNGIISIPVDVKGIEYKDVTITVSDINGNNLYYIDRISPNKTKLRDEHVLEFKYNGALLEEKNRLPVQKYLLRVFYNKEGYESVGDSLIVQLNKDFYEFTISNPTYEPEPLSPNTLGGGKISFNIDTVNIENINNNDSGLDELTTKHVFKDNAHIYNEEGNEVTELFTKEAIYNGGNINSFNLVLSINENVITPGIYTLKTNYKEKMREKTFVISDYLKNISIIREEIISNTLDNKIHKNLRGTFRLYYSSIYEINKNHLLTNIYDDDNNDVTDIFNININDDYIDIFYKGNDLIQGDLKVQFTYNEDGIISISSPYIITIYSTYKEINLINLQSSSSTIFADIDGGYYTFDVNAPQLTTEEKNSLKAKVYSKGGKILYDQEVGIIDKFNIEVIEGKYKLSIIPYKVMVGEYYVSLSYLNSDNEYVESNRLKFTIDDTYYKLNILRDSSITPKIAYGPDNTSLYSRDQYLGSYHYETTYVEDVDYSIKVYNGEDEIIEVKDFTNQDNILTFTLLPLEANNYQVYICANGLPYDKLDIIVKQYIETTDLKVLINNVEVKDKINNYVGDVKTISYILVPSNATDVNINYISSNSVCNVLDNKLYINNEGESTLTVSNQEITKNIRIFADRKIKSNIYSVDYNTNIIFVPTMNTYSLSKSIFMSNLEGVRSDYRLYDPNNSDVTYTATIMKTGMKIKNGSDTYIVSIIGDINGDGIIKVSDVSQMYSHIRGNKKITNPASLKAADLSKNGTVKLSNVSKLYSFVRGNTRSI